MNDVIKVGMADLNVATPPIVLRTVGLGSCVGITLFDPITKIAGMAHIMLPESNASSNVNTAKYADTAIPVLISKMKDHGAHFARLVAKIAGGSQMFATTSKSDLLRVGPRNVEAVKSILQDFKIPLLAEDTGGNCGRTIDFSSLDGMLTIRTVSQGVKSI